MVFGQGNGFRGDLPAFEALPVPSVASRAPGILWILLFQAPNWYHLAESPSGLPGNLPSQAAHKTHRPCLPGADMPQAHCGQP